MVEQVEQKKKEQGAGRVGDTNGVGVTPSENASAGAQTRTQGEAAKPGPVLMSAGTGRGKLSVRLALVELAGLSTAP